jgi:excisionase family DNA binding protein
VIRPRDLAAADRMIAGLYRQLADAHEARAELAAATLVAATTPCDRIPHHACILGSRKTLRLIHEGKLAAEQDGRTYYVRAADVDAYLAARAVVPPATASNDAADVDPLLAILSGRRGRR